MATASSSPPVNGFFKSPWVPVSLRINLVIVWQMLCGALAVVMALMLLLPDVFRGMGGPVDSTLDTLQSISGSTVFRWAPPTFIDGAVIVLLTAFGLAMLLQVPGLVQRGGRARLIAMALNFVGFMFASFYMLRQMTVNQDVLLASIDDAVRSGPLYDVVNSLPGFLRELLVEGYWLDRLLQGVEVLPIVLLFGGAAWLLFGRGVGSAFKETLAQREAIQAYLYISPYLLLASIFTIGLFTLAFYLSFNDLDLFGAATWVGLDNYQEALGDTKFLTAISNVIWYALIVVSLQTVGALVLATVMNAKFVGRRFFRTVFYAPSVTSPVVISLIFLWLFSGRGFVNTIVFERLGLGPAIEDLGIRIPPGSPGLQWYNTPDRLGDLTYLKPFFGDTWAPGFLVLFALLALVMVPRAIMWARFRAFNPRAVTLTAAVSAAATVAGLILYAVAGGSTSRGSLLQAAVAISSAAVALSPLVTNRFKLDLDRPRLIRGTLIGGVGWLAIVWLVTALLGGTIGELAAPVSALALMLFGLLFASALVRPAEAKLVETNIVPWADLQEEGPITLVSKVAVFGGVTLPVLLSLLFMVGVVIANNTLGYESANRLPDNEFVPLVVRGPSVAFMTIMLQNIFTTIPTFMIMYLAALQDIPPTLYEAAQIDGASRFQQFRLITVPLLMPITLLIVVLGTIGTLQLFDQIAIITRGGPLDTTLTPVYLIYTTALGSQIRARVGYASAMAFILGVIIFAFTFVQQRYLERGTEQY